MTKKLQCKLIGEGENIFGVIARVRKTLLKNNLDNKVEEMQNRVINSKSYDEALIIISEYVEIV